MASSIPAYGWVLIALGAAIVVVAILSWLTASKRFSLRDKVVVITGGSSGIGRAVAQIALEKGAHVALLARKTALLEEAVAYLAGHKSSSQRLTMHSVDVADDVGTDRVMNEVAAAHGGKIDVLVNSAGISLPKTFADTSAAEFMNVFKINVVGTRNATHAVLPYMRDPASGGRIVCVSSQAGQVGVFGYTAYSASKFALNGFAQALQQEVYTRNIKVSLCFPPDTDTPMFAEENKTKPLVTKLLSESTSVVPASTVAASLVAGVEHWRPLIAVGFDGWMLCTLNSGMGPAGTLATGAIQVLTMGLWRLIALLYLQSFYSVVAKHDRPTQQTASKVYESAAKSLAAPLVSEDAKTK